MPEWEDCVVIVTFWNRNWEGEIDNGGIGSLNRFSRNGEIGESGVWEASWKHCKDELAGICYGTYGVSKESAAIWEVINFRPGECRFAYECSRAGYTGSRGFIKKGSHQWTFTLFILVYITVFKM